MRRAVFFTVFFALVAAYVLPAASATPDRWIHVRIHKPGNSTESVRVNLPIGVARAVLPLIQKELDANMELEAEGLKIQDLREAWKELREARGADLVTIDSDDAKIRVTMERDQVLVRTAEGSEAEIDVRLPVDVVDALLSAEGERLDITAAFEALMRSPRLDLVSVRKGEDRVRVWIDERADG